MALDFRLARVDPNLATNVQTAFEGGRERARSQARDQILAGYNTDPEGTATSIMGVDPSLGIQLAQVNRANTAQDATLARQRSVDEREARARGAVVVSAVLRHARMIRDPNPERQAQMRRQFLTETAAQMGQLNPDAAPMLQQEAATVGVDDQTLDGHIAALGGEHAPVSVAAGGRLVDPTTGREVYRAPANPRYQPVPEGGRLVLTNPEEFPDGAPSNPDLAAPPSHGAAAPGAPAHGGPVTFQAPVSGGHVSSEFGPRARPMVGASADHHGRDYAEPEGTVVQAAADGVVIAPVPGDGLGTSVRIRHADGSVSIYGHLQAAEVEPGTQVNAGQQIGRVGHTGVATGNNLHFEILDPSGHPIDPRHVLNRPAQTTPAAPPPPASHGGPPRTIEGPPRAEGHYGTAAENAQRGFTHDAIVYYPPHGAPQRLDREGDHPHGDDQTILNDADLTFAAGIYMQTGQMPQLGNRSGPVRQQILHRAREIAQDTGESGPDAAVRWSTNRAAVQTLRSVETRRALVEQTAAEARSAMRLVLQGMPDGRNGANPLVNRPYRFVLNQLGDAGVSQFNIAVNTFGELYARVMTAATGSAGATVDARQRAHELLNPNQSPAQIRGNLARMETEMAAQTQALDAAADEARARIRTGGRPRGAGAPAVGTVRNGYRYTGGDPARRESWQHVQ